MGQSGCSIGPHRISPKTWQPGCLCHMGCRWQCLHLLGQGGQPLASSLPVTTKATSASAPPSRLMATLLSSETAAQVPSCSATLAFCSSLLFFQCLDLGSHHLHRRGLRRSLRAWRRPSIRPSIPRVCSVAIGSSGQAVQNLPSP